MCCDTLMMPGVQRRGVVSLSPFVGEVDSTVGRMSGWNVIPIRRIPLSSLMVQRLNFQDCFFEILSKVPEAERMTL